MASLLLANYNNRVSSPSFNSFDENENWYTGMQHCYWITDYDLAMGTSDNIFELTFKLEQRALVDTIIVLQNTSVSSNFLYEILTFFDIFVGDSPDYNHNIPCVDSPYLSSGTLSSADTGTEVLCELYREYVSIVADYSSVTQAFKF